MGLKQAQHRQKSYIDRRRRSSKFWCLWLFLKASSCKDTIRFGIKTTKQPSPNVFYVSMLRKYELDLSHVVDWQDFQIEDEICSTENGGSETKWLQQWKCYMTIMELTSQHGNQSNKRDRNFLREKQHMVNLSHIDIGVKKIGICLINLLESENQIHMSEYN